ncbi:exopolygalacturonase-like protein [Cinnamomum micranthum f. kanehirae]|uniref:Exopolygalacturonase-like protein n=1 Tax=Cinnamomum micranthum f. kanehirae TaxID=337451 RepID=A0A443PKI6_9MAGN|nr:exopolygalacturonase-like protein [Cinnamomum micranthum f. kanehirae]
MMRHSFFLSFICCFIGVALCGEFNIMDHGAKADGKTDDAKAFQDAWTAACGSSGPATIIVPKGDYWMGPLKFTGPCKGVPSITMKLDGHLLAETDLNKFPSGDWVYFGWIDGLTITGTGVFDGQGASIWHLNDCQQNEKCKLLPTNVKFMSMTNTVIDGITSLNSKNFNFGVVECKNFKAVNFKVTNPGDSPNTDGMHVERCSDVTIEGATIGTGDDCISLGQGLTNVHISKVTCGPGHGISVGSLGKYPDEKDVTGLIVSDSTISDTLNGIRIKSWGNSPSASSVSNVTFENITFKNVNNPIIIDQEYCPSGACANDVPSKVQISDVTFKNIQGTSASEVGVTLLCSKGLPCKNVKLQDINITPSKGSAPLKSTCDNIKALYTGTQVPPPCP